MFSEFLRLNVGQVEVLTLYSSGTKFFFRSPLNLSADHKFEIKIGQKPIFAAVPVPSGICFVPANDLLTVPSTVREAHDTYIRAAASYKHVSPFKKSFSPAVIEYLEEATGESLPRPSYLADRENSPVHLPPDNAESSIPIHERLPQEIIAGSVFSEGSVRQVLVNRYERDSHARADCIRHYGCQCIVCGFDFARTYGPDAAQIIHVHHVRPLSEIGSEYEVDPVKDLRSVCPNCHAVIHARTPAFSIEEVKAFLQQAREFPR